MQYVVVPRENFVYIALYLFLIWVVYSSDGIVFAIIAMKSVLPYFVVAIALERSGKISLN